MRTKKSIAFTIGSLGTGGAERVVSTLANELIHSYNVTIINFSKKSPFYKLDPRINLVYCLEELMPSKSIFDTIRLNWQLYLRIKNIVTNYKIQLLIGFLTRENILSVMAAKSCKIPVIISERNNPYKMSFGILWKLLLRFSYPKADYLVIQTKEIEQYFKAFVKTEKLKILANPIASQLTNSRTFSLERKKVILNVGRLSEQKAQHILIKAFANIKSEGWEVHIVGKGGRQRELQNLINQLNMEEKIKLLPPTKEIATYYNSSSVFVFTSIFEGFPNALIEAMHFGLPCIATDCPTGPSELIRNNENGYLINVNDVLDLQKKLDTLMNNKALRDKFSLNAINEVDRFRAKEIAKNWEKLISSSLA
ncbi:glycosyltransferase family 4 protein [Euzebyella saccharophila]|uniref:Glycosyltransferase family 4 protein n=1 Tax=Euzebyella saccharophila TaxID=679664 RepID=A0ABV8K131_9FLAO|nr:glycosyltransferase family 4 protein [Euzebyella saccharophila]